MASRNGSTHDLRPPYDAAAERAVLGCCLVAPDAVAEVVGVITPREFHLERHRAIFTACLDLWLAGAPVNSMTVARRLAEQGRLDVAGGMMYLTQLAAEAPPEAGEGARHYAGVVLRDAQYRRLARVGEWLAGQAARGGAAPESLLLEAADRLGQAVGTARHGFRTAAEIAAATYDELMAILDDPLAIRGLATGLHGLDAATGGLEPNRLYILAGSTSAGKTALALQVALHVAAELARRAGDRPPARVLYNSLEMSGVQLAAYRAVFALAGVSRKHVFHPGRGWTPRRSFTGDEQRRVNEAVGRFAQLPLDIPEAGIPDVGLLRAAVRARARVAGGLGLVVVDHLHRMDLPRGLSTAEAYGEVVRALKDLAVECAVPVLLLVQLNRDAEREGRRPSLRDLRGSGRIEEEGDFVGLLYRPSARTYWMPPPEDPVFRLGGPVGEELARRIREGDGCPQEYVELICEKVRDGELTTVRLWYDLRVQRWWDLAAALAVPAGQLPLVEPDGGGAAADTGGER